MIPTKNISSKTPAPPIEIKPGLDFLAFLKLRISAPINVPKTPDTKPHGAAKS